MDMRHIASVIVVKEDDMYVAKDIATNVASQGVSVEDAIDSLREALELYYEDNDSAELGYETVFTTTLEVCV